MFILRKPSFDSKNCINIILHVTILFTILALLFKYYISGITVNALNGNIGSLINQIINQTPQINTNLTNQLNIKSTYDYYYKLFSKEDYVKKTSNDKVFYYINLFTIVLIVFCIGSIVHALQTNSISGSDLKVILIENLLTFTLVGVIEYIFFTRVALKYAPTTPSLLSSTFINSLKKNLSN